ncbi:hypothetical protein Baya_5653 [Bagarius yarrelli]|uniref:Uncharacterized protein n=1 Tax=Bagarius yarrelli TaxID=175774 RepID=A0A556TWD3_BAGYA|nr:hypothetical protein Baya_5653 [Bagarius yarrelli]
MEAQSGLVNLDKLLLQLIYKAGIEEKKNRIKDTQKIIRKLDEDIQQTENTIECYKTNIKSLRAASDHLLQYEKMLEAELEKRQESCNQEIIENYRKIFRQHEEEYSQDPLAAKLLKIQAENEEIDRRIRVIEEEITAKGKELKDLQERSGTDVSVQKQLESNQHQASPCGNDTQTEADITTTPDSQVQDIKIETDEKVPENIQDQADGGDESNSSEVGGIGSTVWTNAEIGGGFCADIHEKCLGICKQDMNTNTSTGADTLENMTEAEEQQKQHAEGTAEEGGEERAVCSTSSPIHMSVLDTPTFGLSSSPSTPQGHQVGGGTPAFVFSMNSGPNTPTFLGFDFEVSPSQHEGFCLTSQKVIHMKILRFPSAPRAHKPKSQ